MLCTAWKWHRRTFWWIFPAIGTFYLATVYGRYHYVSDTIAGIGLGMFIAWLAPRVERAWQKWGG
jgi:membrane-associated phospholipid phosphatase